MGKETLTEKRDWLHNQLNGAIALAVLTTSFVFLRCVGLGVLNWQKKNLIRFSFWEDALILASLIAFLPLCVCAIGKEMCSTLKRRQIDQYQWTRMHILPCTLLKGQSKTRSPYSKPVMASVSPIP